LTAPPLLDVAMIGIYPLSVDEVNKYLVEWDHKLGPCERPFRSEGFALIAKERIVAVAMSCSIVHGPVAGYQTQEVVELARLAACEPWANRVMLRLWREICAPSWHCWPVKAAVSYSHNGLHSGNLYRFDGWEKIKDNCGTNGKGGNWGRRGRGYAHEAIHGLKTLWCWRYPSA
jgi:hypothetical protein